MKIAMIGQKGVPSRSGGVEIHVEEIGARLAKSNNEVTVYCRKSYCDEIKENHRGINLKYIPSINTKHLDAITYTLLASLDAARSKYDVVHYHALGPSLLSFIPRMFGKKVVCTVHGLDWQREKWGKVAKKALKLGELATAKFPHKTISVSESISNYYNETYNNDTIFVPNGIDEKISIEASEIIEKYGLHKDEYILFLARLVPEKGVHYLIEAYNKLNTNKKLIIAGGSSHSDDYVNKVNEMAKENPNIIMTGFVNGNLLEELFSNAYMYVLPSEIEGLPISLLEAMSYGNCCLVSDIDECASVVEDKAIIFKKSNVADLQSKLQEACEDARQVQKYKDEAADYICGKYNWDDVVERTLELYRR